MPIFGQLPGRCEGGLRLLCEAVDTNQHAPRQVPDEVPKLVFHFQRIQRGRFRAKVKPKLIGPERDRKKEQDKRCDGSNHSACSVFKLRIHIPETSSVSSTAGAASQGFAVTAE